MRKWSGKQWMCLGLMLCLLSCPLLSLAGAYPLAVINNPTAPYLVHLRKGPGTSTESLGQYYSGVEVVVYDKSSEWWKVEIYDREGYMDSKFLLPAGAQGEEKPDAVAEAYDATRWAEVRTKDGGRLNIRRKPNEDWASHGKYADGTRVKVMGMVGDWSYVHVENEWGYMKSEFLAPADGPAATAPPMEAATTAEGYATVNNPNADQRLSLREEPWDGAASLDSFYNGTLVGLLERTGDWYKVRVYGQVGYMKREFLRLDTFAPDLLALDYGIVVGAAKMEELPVWGDPTQAQTDFYIPYEKGETTVEILERAGVYYRVRLDEQEMFVHSRMILPGRREPEPKLFGKIGVISSPSDQDRLHLRAKPARDADSLGQYFNGTQVELLNGRDLGINFKNWQDSDGWYHVKVNGLEGYMMAKFISPVFSGEFPTTD